MRLIFALAVAFFAFSQPLAGQDWVTTASWSGEPGTIHTPTLDIEAVTWRVVWEVEDDDMLPVFSVLVFAEPEGELAAEVSSREVGRGWADFEVGPGAYVMEISSTLPWSLLLQVREEDGFAPR